MAMVPHPRPAPLENPPWERRSPDRRVGLSRGAQRADRKIGVPGRNAPRAGFTLIELTIVVAIVATMVAIAVPNFLEAQVRAKISRTKIDMAALEYALGAYAADHDGRYPPHNLDMAEFLAACTTTATAASLPNHPLTPELRAAGWPMPAPPPARLLRTSGRPADPTGGDRARARSGLPPEWGSGSNRWSRARGSDQAMRLLSTGEQDLAPLTTPIAYATGTLPADPFADHRDQVFAFINLRDLREAYPSQPVGGPGAAGAARRFVLMSFGPDTDEAVPNLANPVRGPFTAYDPTNGTVSPGDIFAFGGANPAGDTGPPPPPPPKSTAPRDPTPSVTAEPANI